MSDTSHTVHLAGGGTPFSLGIRGLCPRCGQGHMFRGFIKIVPRCEVCGLDYSFADPADGPAFFAQWAGCIPAVIFALWLQASFDPPYWMHLVTTLPLLVLPPLALLRPIKGWLVCSQYLYRAEEGQIASGEE